jgi:hypothetical protein
MLSYFYRQKHGPLAINKVSVAVPPAKHPIYVTTGVKLRIYPRGPLKNPGYLGAIDPCNEGDSRDVRSISVTRFLVCCFVNADRTKQALSLWATDTMRYKQSCQRLKHRFNRI